MAYTRAWRNFKRMQDTTVALAALVYAGAMVRAFEVLPGGAGAVARWTLAWPAPYLVVSLGLPLAIPPLRRLLARYVWMSFQSGFGQRPGSIVTSAILMLAAGLFIYRQIEAVVATGHYGANVFAAFAAGVGVMAAQAALSRTIEADPEKRPLIEES